MIAFCHLKISAGLARVACLTVVVAWQLAIVGCGGSEATPTETVSRDTPPSTQESAPPQNDTRPKPNDRPTNIFTNPAPTEVTPADDPPTEEPPRQSGLGDLLDTPEGREEFGKIELEPMAIDEERVAANGIRKIAGERLTLYTDLPANETLAELPAIFSQAVPQWMKRFDVAPDKAVDWKMTGFLMNDRDKFRQAGLLPAHLPQFREGYQLGLEFWFDEQDEDYYRRHLMLHEGTHGFMRGVLGGAGPPWFMEGMAELMATHQWKDNTLTLNVAPQHKEDTPGWGRIRIIKDEYKAGRGMSPTAILQYGPSAHLKNAPYGWSWGLCWFFDQHPDYQKEFRGLTGNVRNETLSFSQQFHENLKAEWPRIQEQWQVFVTEIDYGYNLPASVIQHSETPAQRPAEGASPLQAKVAVDHGWQSTGIELAEGVTYDCAATGNYQLKTSPEVWNCTADGVTIEYHRGRPLGLLEAAIRPLGDLPDQVTVLTQSEPLGSRKTVISPRTGVLYVRINEAAGELADNRGNLTIHVRPAVN